MKIKLIHIFLILCLLAPMAISFIILKKHKKEVQREIKRMIVSKIDKNELVKLKFTEKEKQTLLRWEHPKEFEYKGEMYDIVKTEVKGDTTYYWCWWDNEETKLNKQLSEMVSVALGNNPQKQEKENRIINFFKSLYFVEPASIFTFLPTNEPAKYFDFQHFYQTLDTSPLVPPPKLS